jgi:hypothetical protein
MNEINQRTALMKTSSRGFRRIYHAFRTLVTGVGSGLACGLSDHTAYRRKIMETKSMQENPVSDLFFDWVSVLHNKAEGVNAYERYLKDAQDRKADRCVELLQKLRDQDIQMLREVKDHLREMFEFEAEGQGLQAGQQSFAQMRENAEAPRH